MKGCAHGLYRDALQVGREGRVWITGNASAGAMAGFPRVRLSPLTAVGAWRNKGCMVQELWAVAWRPNGTDNGTIWPEHFVSAPKLRAAVAATAVLTQGKSAACLFASLAVVAAIS